MGRHSIHSAKTRGSQPGRLRIVAGKWRSRLLPVAEVDGLRPTSERIRETLFNWLAPGIEGAHCLDLFAGTGALGLEALSRGAGSVTFVEKSAIAANALRSSLDTLGASGASVHHIDAMSMLRNTPPRAYDLVFLDPPFASDLGEDLCRLLAADKWLTPGAHVYLEQEKRQAMTNMPAGWQPQKEKTTGNVRYTLIKVQ